MQLLKTLSNISITGNLETTNVQTFAHLRSRKNKKIGLFLKVTSAICKQIAYKKFRVYAGYQNSIIKIIVYFPSHAINVADTGIVIKSKACLRCASNQSTERFSVQNTILKYWKSNKKLRGNYELSNYLSLHYRHTVLRHLWNEEEEKHLLRLRRWRRKRQ